MSAIYFKSFGGNELTTTTYNPNAGKRTICQTLDQVLSTKVIKPNTTHSKLPNRLCVSLITQGFQGSYRPEGVIFSTTQKPNYCSPFDLMALTDGTTFTSSDFNSSFLKGSERFVFSDPTQMRSYFPNSDCSIKALNEFRRLNGLGEIKYEEMKYNEFCFNNKVEIVPIAVVGTSQGIKDLSEKYGLLVYGSVKEYLSNSSEGGD